MKIEKVNISEVKFNKKNPRTIKDDKFKKLMLGDNIKSLKKLPDNSVDSVVTDPPYGLSFMNKKWDYDVPSVEFWKEVYRVLKPGGHVLSFGGTRTYHRMVVNMEDAGFEIRDQIMWLYGSGFPKSHNIGKSVDKLQGNEREVVGSVNSPDFTNNKGSMMSKETSIKGFDENYDRKDVEITKGQSEYEGWGTALKPANEPICLARKPLSEKSVAENVLKWGTGGINIDGCRVGSETITINRHNLENISGTGMGQSKEIKWSGESVESEGRFPANLILECCCDEVIKGEKGERKPRPKVNDHNENSIFGIGGVGIENYDYKDKGDIHTNPECPCFQLDEQSGISKTNHKGNRTDKGIVAGVNGFGRGTEVARQDSGGASRFFYQAKVSKKERNMGLEHFEEKQQFGQDGKQKCSKCNLWNSAGDGRELCKCIEPEWIRPLNKNTHPTVKPVSLMTYLCRLVTPEGGIVLDPFMGSGSTGVAALLEGFDFVGIDMTEDYVKIAEARIKNYEKYRDLLK